MAANEIHVNDIGTVFEVTLLDEGSSPQIVDLSTATVKELIFKDPAGTSTTQTAAFTTDGTDGKIQYTTLTGDLDTAGLWYLQAHIVIGTASPINGEWRSDIGQFEVFDNL